MSLRFNALLSIRPASWPSILADLPIEVEHDVRAIQAWQASQWQRRRRRYGGRSRGAGDAGATAQPAESVEQSKMTKTQRLHFVLNPQKTQLVCEVLLRSAGLANSPARKTNSLAVKKPFIHSAAVEHPHPENNPEAKEQKKPVHRHATVNQPPPAIIAGMNSTKSLSLIGITSSG